MRSTIAAAALVSVAAASMVADFDGGNAIKDIGAPGHVDEPIYEDDYGVDTYSPEGHGITGVTEDHRYHLEACLVYDEKDEHHECDTHHDAPERPVVYETVVHTVISCEVEVVCISARTFFFSLKEKEKNPEYVPRPS